MRLLAFTPLHPDYGIHGAALDGILRLVRPKGVELHMLFVDGDNDDKPFVNIVKKHNYARQIVLDNDYDYMLSIEADMIVPPDTILRLLQADADIAYGLYVWRQHNKRWSAYKDINLWGGHSISFNHGGQDAKDAWGKVIDVAGLGMGCTLISRKVLKRLPFRLHDGSDSWIQDEYAGQFKTLGIDPKRKHLEMVCDDWLLAMDAQHYGFTQRAHCGVVCGHIDGDGVLWPDPYADMLYRVEA